MVVQITTNLEELVFDEKNPQKILRKSDRLEVRAKPIGPPVMIGDVPDDFSEVQVDNSQLIYIDRATPEGANAYCKGNEELVAGEIVGPDDCWYGSPVQYYKILK